jgi:hypothetical protein
MNKYPGPSEHEIQVAYFEIVKYMENIDGRWGLIFAVPNGGHRSKRTAASMKREGQRAGVWDVFISVPNNGYHGAYLETKRTDLRPKTERAVKGGLSDDQIEWRDKVETHGYFTAVCYSVEELQTATEDYLNSVVK